MSSAEKSEMEDIIRTEKLRRSGESASLNVTEPQVDGDEVTENMKEQVHTRLEQISSSMEEEKKKFQARLEHEMEQFDRKQTSETDKLREKHDRDKSSLTARHRQEEVELVTEQTKEVFRLRMKQYREKNEMVEKQKQQREWRLMEMKQRMNSIINNLDPVTDTDTTAKPESRYGQSYFSPTSKIVKHSFQS